MNYPRFFVGTIAVFFVFSFIRIKKKSSNEDDVWIKQKFLKSISKQKEYIHQLIYKSNLKKTDISLFKELRIEFSSQEHLISYYFPKQELLFNSPPVYKYNDELPDSPPTSPSGFQLIEQLYAEDSLNYEEIKTQLNFILNNYHEIETNLEFIIFSSSELFDCYRQQLYRIASLYMSGNDAPIFKNIFLKKSSISLQNIKIELSKLNKKETTFFENLVDSCNLYLNNSYNLSKDDSILNFDYFNFYKNHLLPIYKNLNLLQKKLNIPYSEKISAINPKTLEINSSEAFNSLWFAKDKTAIPTASKIVELGRILFYDPILSQDLKRSCASCHQPSLAFTDGLEKNKSLHNGVLSRNTPTLINCGLQYGQFWDLRVNFLETQVKHVVGNENEMNGHWTEIISILKNSKEYTQLFTEAYSYSRDTAITTKNIVRAITMFERTLNAMNSEFDLALQGKTIINQSVKNGFNIFMNKGACGTCHFFPLFNGTIPPNFYETESEVLGVPINFTNNKKVLDDDIGRMIKMKSAYFKYSFKTPSIRNAAITSPYMHNGGFKTLEEVIDFYDAGGGKGIGIKVENQTLSSDSLKLTEIEKKDLIHFIKSLTDTVGINKVPSRLPDIIMPNNTLINNRKPLLN